jgi:hypothetical protein
MTDEPQEPEGISDGAMVAVRALLTAADAYSIGVSFEPDSQGWKVGYLQGMGGGDLASAYDLETAARAAMRPLDDLHDQLAQNRRPG